MPAFVYHWGFSFSSEKCNAGISMEGRVQFGFATVAGALARVNLIREDARPAFDARLKHFQRLEFPPGTNTGRGRAAVYDIGHLLQLAFALELVQLGVPPERAKTHVENTVGDFARLLHLMLLQWNKEGAPQYAVGLWPSGLLPLMGEAMGKVEGMLLFGSLEDFARNMDSSEKTHLPRFAYSNLSLMFDMLSEYLSAQLKVDVAAVCEAALDWTLQVAAKIQHADDPQA